MKKALSLLSLMVLTTTVSFAGTLNYFNRTSQTLRMLVNGAPACTSDVMPGGYCSTSAGISIGTYLMQATNGQETTGGYSCYLPTYDSSCDYTVNESTSKLLSPSTKLVTVSQTQYDGFSVNAPITLTTDGPEQSTTNEGKAFTQTTYTGTMPNSDFYLAGVSVYPFTVVEEDLTKATNGFVQAAKGTILMQGQMTVSGQPALMSVISAKDANGRELSFAFLVTHKGNRAYMFVFGSYVDVTSNEQEFKEFFSSISIN